jgi:hypothetical protein
LSFIPFSGTDLPHPKIPDYVPFLSVKAAIDFRTWLGGEERITKYCHELALEGGKVAQKIFGPNSRIMENEDSS